MSAFFAFFGLICVWFVCVLVSLLNSSAKQHAERAIVSAERFGERVAMRDSALSLRALNALRIDERIREELDRAYGRRS